MELPESTTRARSQREDVRVTLARAKTEVEQLRRLVPSATLHKRACSEILEASDACLLQLEQSLAAGVGGAGPDPSQLERLLPAATQLLQATRRASHKVKKLGKPTGMGRLVAWTKRSTAKAKLMGARCEITAALDYTNSAMAALAAAGGDEGAEGSLRLYQATALAAMNFEPGTLRHTDVRSPVAAVRFLPSLGPGPEGGGPLAGAGGGEVAMLLLVELAGSGTVQVYAPSMREFHTTLRLAAGGAGAPRLTATAVDWAAQALWSCFSDGTAVLAGLGEQKSVPHACTHAPITCAHAAPGSLWLGDAAGRVVCLQREPEPQVRVVTSRGVAHAMSAIACVWAQDSGMAAAAADSEGWLMLIDTDLFAVQDSFNCQPLYGAVTCITELPWAYGSADRVGPAAAQRSASVPAPVLTARGWSSLGGLGGGSAAGAHCGWRLLTGHSSGLLVLWEAGGGRLRAMSVLGEPCAPVRGLAVLRELSMLVTGHRDGLLRVWPLPSARMHLMPLPHSQAPQWALRHGVIRAHRTRLTAMDRCGTRLATGSEVGSVKVWDVLDLRARAMRQGATFQPLVSASALASAASLSPASLDLPLHLQLAASQLFLSMHRPPSMALRSATAPSAAIAAAAAAAAASMSAAAPARAASGVPGEPQPAGRRSSSGAAAAAAAAAAASGGPGQQQLMSSISSVQPSPAGMANPGAAGMGVATSGGSFLGPGGGLGLGLGLPGNSLGLAGPLSTTTQRALEAAMAQEVFARASAANAAFHSGGASAAAAAMGGGAPGMMLPNGMSLPALPPGLAGSGMPVMIPLSPAPGGSGQPVWALLSPLGPGGFGSGGGAMGSGLFGTPRLDSVREEDEAGMGPVAVGLGPSAGRATGSSAPLSNGSQGPVVAWPGGGPSPLGAAGSEANTMLALRNQFLKDTDIRLIEEIGNGAEGRVWRGKWHHISVAIKEMHPKSASFARIATIARELTGARGQDPFAAPSPELQALMKEVTCLIDLSQHPNIVRFIGVCLLPPRIVLEYYPKGSLFGLIEKARDEDDPVARGHLDWMGRLAMLHDIAAGMAFLHDRNYMHGDLRSPNVFVTMDGHAKVGDFGFAQLLAGPDDKESDEHAEARLSNPRWLAPEVIMAQKSSQAGDVYSFAIIMYELLTWMVPYAEYDSLQVVVFHGTWSDSQPLFRPDLPYDHLLPQVDPTSGSLAAFKQLMAECWAQSPQDRPSFSAVAVRLQSIIHWEQALTHVRATALGGLAGGGLRSATSGALRSMTSSLLSAVPPSADLASVVAAARLAAASRQSTSITPDAADPPGGRSASISAGWGAAAGGNVMAAVVRGAMAAAAASAASGGGGITARSNVSGSGSTAAAGASSNTPAAAAAAAATAPLAQHASASSLGPEVSLSPSASDGTAQSTTAAVHAAIAGGGGANGVMHAGSGGVGVGGGGLPTPSASPASTFAPSGSASQLPDSVAGYGTIPFGHSYGGGSAGSPYGYGSPSAVGTPGSAVTSIAPPTVDLVIADASGIQHASGAATATLRSRMSSIASGAIGGGGGGRRTVSLSGGGAPPSADLLAAAAAAAASVSGSAAGGDGSVAAEATLSGGAADGAAEAGPTELGPDGEAGPRPGSEAAEAAVEVAQRVLGPTRRITALQVEGEVILLIQDREGGDGGGDGGGEGSGGGADGAAAEAAEAEAGDTVSELPKLLQHLITSQQQDPSGGASPGASPPPPSHSSGAAGLGPGAFALGVTRSSVASSGLGPGLGLGLGPGPGGPGAKSRSSSAGSGVAVALASVNSNMYGMYGGPGGGGGATASSGATARGKGSVSIKAMSSFVQAVESMPDDVVSSLLGMSSAAPSGMGGERRSTAFSLSGAAGSGGSGSGSGPVGSQLLSTAAAPPGPAASVSPATSTAAGPRSSCGVSSIGPSAGVSGGGAQGGLGAASAAGPLGTPPLPPRRPGEDHARWQSDCSDGTAVTAATGTSGGTGATTVTGAGSSAAGASGGGFAGFGGGGGVMKSPWSDPSLMAIAMGTVPEEAEASLPPPPPPLLQQHSGKPGGGASGASGSGGGGGRGVTAAAHAAAALPNPFGTFLPAEAFELEGPAAAGAVGGGKAGLVDVSARADTAAAGAGVAGPAPVAAAAPAPAPLMAEGNQAQIYTPFAGIDFSGMT